MKILIATGIYPPSVGGPATYAKLLFDELPNKDKEIDVKVLSFEAFLKFPKFISQGLYFINLFFKGLRVDIIYAMDPVTVGFPAMIASKILKKKFVVKIVGDRAWEQGFQEFGITENLDDFIKNDKEYSGRLKTIKRIQKRVAENADKIIVPSHYLKNIVKQWGINPDKIVVIYNAFEGANIIETKKEIRDDLYLDNVVITSAGRLVPWKGFGTLIAIIPNLIKKFPRIRLLIMGDGPQRKELEKLIKHGGLEDYVELLGDQKKEDLYKYIKASDVFVLNTGYEGLSHQLLEVLSIGTPIVTTNVGGNPEIITNKINGLLIEYNNKKALEQAIERLITDYKLAGDFIREGKETVKKFNKEEMLNKLIRELKNL